MNKNIEYTMLGATVLLVIGLVTACLWFLYEIRVLHWVIIFMIMSWLMGAAIRKWGFEE